MPGDQNQAILARELKRMWNGGYDAAVQSVREMADEFGDEQMKLAAKAIADLLLVIKPEE